ncbi:MAG: hypothetical protein LBH80_00870 [Prevotellaceae bacterium]|jgi:hypothetical protein|nr:hypothetical protein [Prevotellaceae bacterium]
MFTNHQSGHPSFVFITHLVIFDNIRLKENLLAGTDRPNLVLLHTILSALLFDDACLDHRHKKKGQFPRKRKPVSAQELMQYKYDFKLKIRILRKVLVGYTKQKKREDKNRIKKCCFPPLFFGKQKKAVYLHPQNIWAL